MKILMLTEYFAPYDFGGSEWSTYYLAKELIKNGHQVIIVTPNYGTKSEEFFEKIKIVRFPFFKKIKNKSPVSPYWHTGLPWLIVSTFYLIKICKRESADIIHVQGKYFSPVAYFAKLILKIPAVLTVRDYQLICNYGFCIWGKTRACSLLEYFTKDFTFYIKNYLKTSSFFLTIANLFFAVNSRITKYFYSFFAKKLDLCICISRAQAKIYRENGFKKIKVIYNPMSFSKVDFKQDSEKQIVYAGRLTPGKGPVLLFEALPQVFKKFRNLKILIAGEGLLKDELKTIAKQNNFGEKIDFLGQLDHPKLLEIYSKSLLTVVPSIWPEPFGRVALESISQGTPVVATDKGGLKEIIDDSLTGYIAKVKSDSLSKAIIKGINNNSVLRLSIQRNYKNLQNKFQTENVKQYIKIYKGLK